VHGYIGAKQGRSIFANTLKQGEDGILQEIWRGRTEEPMKEELTPVYY
jgi:hypothetical protein